VIDAVRSAVREINPNEAIFDVKTMDRIVEESLSSFTTYLTLMVVFAVLALVLALTGTYGVMAYAAASRARECAIRVALGASRSGIMRLVFRKGLLLTALGVAAGVSLAILVAPVLRALPVAVSPPDFYILGPIAFLIGLIAMVACMIPALRAAGVDAMAILRHE
jgi:putative ABC transport system permease protein